MLYNILHIIHSLRIIYVTYYIILHKFVFIHEYVCLKNAMYSRLQAITNGMWMQKGVLGQIHNKRFIVFEPFRVRLASNCKQCLCERKNSICVPKKQNSMLILNPLEKLQEGEGQMHGLLTIRTSTKAFIGFSSKLSCRNIFRH